MTDFSTSLELRIDWSDLDTFGHVNNLAILRYAQSARVHFMEVTGQMDSHARDGIAPVLASTHCQFRKQLFYPGRVTVQSRVEQVNTTSFHLRHRVLDEAGDLVADSLDVLVMFDYRNNVKLRIPQAFRERVAAAEGIPG